VRAAHILSQQHCVGRVVAGCAGVVVRRCSVVMGRCVAVVVVVIVVRRRDGLLVLLKENGQPGRLHVVHV